MLTSHSLALLETVFCAFLLLLLLLGGTLCDEQQASITCKEHPVLNSTKVNTECWIDANLRQLHCSPDWYALHLEVINLQSKETSSSAAETAPVEVSLNPEVFEYCPDLRVLAVWENSHLTRLQPEVLRPLASLERLVIRSKRTRTLEKHLFAFLPRLQSLTISGSPQFTHLDRKVLEPCPQLLNSIDLSNNNLSGLLPPSLFRHCNLKNLYLQNNRLTGLDLDSLSGLVELRYLRLDGNQLSGSLEAALGAASDASSGMSVLASTPRLEVLDLSDNELESINSAQWSGGLQELRRLSLSRNSLRWLDPEAFRGLPKLSELQLDGNPALLTPDGFASLAVVFFSLSSQGAYPNLRHVSFPGDPTTTASLDVCAITQEDADAGLITLPVILRRTTALLRARICVPVNEGEATTGAPATEAAFPASRTDEDWIKRMMMNETQPLLLPPEDEVHDGDVVAFIRRAPRWMLACLGFGLLFLGILIALIVFGTLYFCLRPIGSKSSFPATPTQLITKGNSNNHHSFGLLPNPVGNCLFSGSRTSVDSPHIYSPEATQLGLPPIPQDPIYSPIGSPFNGSANFYMPLIRSPGPTHMRRLYQPRGVNPTPPPTLSARQRLSQLEQRKRASLHLLNTTLSNSTYSLLPPRSTLSASMNVLNLPAHTKQAIV